MRFSGLFILCFLSCNQQQDPIHLSESPHFLKDATGALSPPPLHHFMLFISYGEGNLLQLPSRYFPIGYTVPLIGDSVFSQQPEGETGKIHPIQNTSGLNP